MQTEQTANTAQLRVLEVQQLLIKSEDKPLKLADIAGVLQKPEATVLRDLRALRVAGWALQTNDGYWRAGVAWEQARRAAIEQAKQELRQMIDSL